MRSIVFIRKIANKTDAKNATHSTAASGTSPSLGEEFKTCQVTSLRHSTKFDLKTVINIIFRYFFNGWIYSGGKIASN